MAATQGLQTQLRAASNGLLASMRAAVSAELERTVARWHAAGKPPGKWIRNAPGSQEDKKVLIAWTWLGADLVYSGRPWEAAAAEPLYQLAINLAVEAEQKNAGLDLHKGIEYFMLGMAQYHEGRIHEALHNVLCAVAEDRAAGLADSDIVAAQQLNARVLPRAAMALAGPAAACVGAGLVHITDAHVNGILNAMCYDHTGAYNPIWLLWLYAAVSALADLPGESPLTPVRRLEALQDLTFMYEAALKERLAPAGGTLYSVVQRVRQVHGYPAVLETRWGEFTNFGPGKTHPSPESALTALRHEAFAPLTAVQAFVCRSILALGLARNTAHHEMNLQSSVVHGDYGWLREQVLAALLVSW